MPIYELSMEDLNAYAAGSETARVSSLRQLHMLLVVGDDLLQNVVSACRLRGSCDPVKLGHALESLIEHNMSLLAMSGWMGKYDETVAAENSGSVSGTAASARFIYRELLVQWRHALRRKFRLPVDTDSAPASCGLCGREGGLRACSRCSMAHYCCRAHQVRTPHTHNHVALPSFPLRPGTHRKATGRPTNRAASRAASWGVPRRKQARRSLRRRFLGHDTARRPPEVRAVRAFVYIFFLISN